MKKLVSLAVLLGLTAPAVAAPSYLTRDENGGYRVTYDYTDKAKTGWYVGARADLNFWTWKNKYHASDNFAAAEEYNEDDYAMAQYELQIPYLMLNGYYDMSNGVYLGLGVGVAMPIETIDMPGYTDGSNRTQYGFAPMAGVMLGYSYELDNNLVLDLRYRLSGMTGLHHRIDDLTSGAETHWFENEIDFVLDNSISIGIRYEF